MLTAVVGFGTNARSSAPAREGGALHARARSSVPSAAEESPDCAHLSAARAFRQALRAGAEAAVIEEDEPGIEQEQFAHGGAV
jgi:hypothetical protein